jgi:hypothetical protein
MNDEKELIIKYALQSPENLRVAKLVAESYDDLKKAVVSSFAEKLEDRLLEKLGKDWKRDVRQLSSKEDCLSKYKGLGIIKNSWDENYFIKIHTDDVNANRLIFGIMKWGKKPKAKSLGEEPYQELIQKKGGNSAKTNWWEWRKDVDKKYRNWTDTDTMYTP